MKKQSSSSRFFSSEDDQPHRLLALSDGLFATVLTLLVLDLKNPDFVKAASSGEMLRALNDFWPHFFSYILTFLVTGVYWMAHHRLFSQIKKHDRRLMWYNLMFLLTVGLMPFSTAIFSSNSFSQDVNPIFWAIYAVNVVFVGVMMALTWGYAMTHGLSDPQISNREAMHILLRQFLTPLLFAISILFKYLSPQTYLAQYFLLTIPLFQLLLDRVVFKSSQALLLSPKKHSLSELLWFLGSMLPLIVLVVISFRLLNM